MANRRIHDLEDTATTLDSGAYIAVDSDSYTAAKKFAADKLPDPTGATDGYVWTADGADGAAWEAVSGGASDVTDLTTTTGSSTNMVRVAAAGGLEYRTTAQVLSDIGALAATGSVTGATSSAQTFTNGVVIGANGVDVNPGSDTDADLITVGVTGTPAMFWDESEDKFSLNKPFIVLAQSGDATLSLRAVQAAQYTGFNIYDNANTLAVSFQYGNTSASVFGDTAFLASRKSTTPLAFYQGGASSGNKRIVLNTSGYTEVHQPGATAAAPVLLLNQADDSEEMIEFTGTVGTGNAIEAVGAKTLTTTHFIKCTITGVGTVYIPVGTIA